MKMLEDRIEESLSRYFSKKDLTINYSFIIKEAKPGFLPICTIIFGGIRQVGILGTVDGRWEWADSEIIAGGYMMEKLCQDLNTQQKDLFQEEPHIPETLNSRIKEILTEHFPEQASIEVTLSDKFVMEDVVPEFSPLCAIILETTEQLGILGTDSGTWAWVDSGSIAGEYLMSKLCQELNGRGLTKEEALYNMRVGDTIPFSHETNSIRVPGGWIFISEGSSCFVKGWAT